MASVVVPTRNPGAGFGVLLDALAASRGVDEIIVIDSASTDGTSELSSQKGARVVGIKENAFDHGGVRFIVADCCAFKRGSVEIGWVPDVCEWVREDIQAHAGVPVFFVTHANLRERPWGAAFDSLDAYGLHPGAVEMRNLLASCGHVVAALSGHVHANRLEVHDGIPCVEIGSTCIARASVRYFCVFSNRTEMTYERLSDASLEARAEQVAHCSPRLKDVEAALALIDGREEDKVATFPHAGRPVAALGPTGP